MKAVLVIDVPYVAKINEVTVDYQLWLGEPRTMVFEKQLCSLKPLPEEKELNMDITKFDDPREFYKDGWNDCLEEICNS